MAWSTVSNAAKRSSSVNTAESQIYQFNTVTSIRSTGRYNAQYDIYLYSIIKTSVEKISTVAKIPSFTLHCIV